MRKRVVARAMSMVKRWCVVSACKAEAEKVCQCGSGLRCPVAGLVRDTRRRRDGVAEVLRAVREAKAGMGAGVVGVGGGG